MAAGSHPAQLTGNQLSDIVSMFPPHQQAEIHYASFPGEKEKCTLFRKEHPACNVQARLWLSG